MTAEARSLVVGVVGTGTMGSGIAQLCLQAGHEVVIYDVDEVAVARGRARIEDGLDRLVAKGRLDVSERDGGLSRLREATGLGDVGAEADVVVEAALEELDLKQRIFEALDEGSPAETLLATNTSALSVSTIAEAATRYPRRVLGLHFFNPAPVMPLVEVVAGDATDGPSVEAAVSFAEGLGKTPVVCRDSPGFIVNRVNRPFTLEALRMLEAGEADVGNIDLAVEEAGYPMGPFRLMDLVGIDVNYAVARALYEAFDHTPRFRPSSIQLRLVDAGHLGRKTGSGFYAYQAGARPERSPWLGHLGIVPDPVAALTPDEIVERIQLAIVNEAYHAVGEQVAGPPDIDRAMRLGANHPRGPFERAGELGLRAVVEGLRRLETRYGERFAIAPVLWQMAHI